MRMSFLKKGDITCPPLDYKQAIMLFMRKFKTLLVAGAWSKKFKTRLGVGAWLRRLQYVTASHLEIALDMSNATATSFVRTYYANEDVRYYRSSAMNDDYTKTMEILQVRLYQSNALPVLKLTNHGEVSPLKR